MSNKDSFSIDIGDLDCDLYKMMYYLIRSYRNIVRQLDEVCVVSAARLYAAPGAKGGKSDPTAHFAIMRSSLLGYKNAVETAMRMLAHKYKNTPNGEVFDPFEAFLSQQAYCYLRNRPMKRSGSDTKSWTRYKKEFAALVARELGLIMG